MRVKTILDEDFINYKEPCMFIGCISCGGKCAKDGNFPIEVCQNDIWRKAKIIDIDDDKIIKRYLSNDITKSIVFGLLEPLEQFDEIVLFIKKLRINYNCNDPIIIYTGYNKNEIQSQINILKQYKNIIIKFGRFQLNHKKHYDDILGIRLASNNQYAEKIS